MLVPIKSIPQGYDYVVVADMFASSFIGGAELTLEAILNKCSSKCFKICSQQLTIEAIESAIDKYWIIGNFAQMSKECLLTLATSNIKYSVIECDYKYCKFRSSHLHKLQTGNDCDCHQQESGRLIKGFYKRSHHTFFMSEGQLNEYKRLFPSMEKWGNKLIVQGSTFDKDSLEFLDDLYQNGGKDKKDLWAVLKGGSWIKNQNEIELYCKNNNIPYELIGDLKYKDFLKELVRYKGLVFHPKGFDTNPRITIEAKLLGLELDLNENVQQQYESWFTGSRENCYDHLLKLPEKFWSHIKE